MTPQESEQLSQYASDDTYVQTQKEDIKELASLFKGMMDKGSEDTEPDIIEAFQKHFVPQSDCHVIYKIQTADLKQAIYLKIENRELECHMGMEEASDVFINTDMDTLIDITEGRMTFQRAFMSTGAMKVKGDFKLLRMLDQIFVFEDAK